MRLTMRLPPDFAFQTAVCSHGFFVLAPNRWDPTRQALQTVVALDDVQAVVVDVRASRDGAKLNVVADSARAETADASRAAIRHAVRRMLRLDEDLSPFHRMCRRVPGHRAAARCRFGRLLRGASLFEDIVKVICTCNVTWRQTVRMVANLVDTFGVPCAGEPGQRGFPTPQRLAGISAAELRRRCSLGYRGDYIAELADRVAGGELNLDVLADATRPTDTLARELRQIRGVGDYAAAHLCMLLGRYERLAVDTEMVRFVEQRTGRRPSPAALRRMYNHWHPYEFLAYWWELWTGYTDRHGPSHEWTVAGVGRRITQ
ncbi:MAG: hypothetical protein JXA69_18070 [Phycisphaerae bacterium]|nr:hypothetical protein [Phycisphaerae bacterium]